MQFYNPEIPVLPATQSREFGYFSVLVKHDCKIDSDHLSVK